MQERCSWCGEEIEADDGLRAYEPAGARTAAFCRLEHVVPWEMQGPHWEADREPPRDVSDAEALCAHCGERLPETRVLLVRHRGEHRVSDGFCTADHMAAWARSGGRWSPGT